MTATTSRVEIASTEYRRAITAGVIGNVLEWYDFGVYGYLVPTISALFFPGGDPMVSLLSTFAVFGVGFVMRPVGSIVFGIYGDKHGRRKALSAVIFVMAIATFAMGLLLTEALRDHPWETFLGFGTTLHNTVAYYIALIFMGSYMINVAKLP